MKSFEYTITDQVGIHARPAGILVKEAKQYNSKIVVKMGDKAAEATKLMALMGMGVKKGDTVTVEVEGDDEDTAVNDMKAFFENNF